MEYKIKLIAIAKDEAAYLPEWIFHHLSVGFDSISILTNGISDNTKDVISKIAQHYPVEDVESDYIKTFSEEGFQRIAYGIEYKRSLSEGYTHVMFLDVDEYWVSKSFSKTIKEYLLLLGEPDAVAFPWALKSGEGLFDNTFSEENTFVLDRHVKTIFRCDINVSKIHPHNIVSPTSKCLLPDGSLFSDEGENRSITVKPVTELPDAFVVHRITRSEKEYISLLGRGRPSNDNSMLALKDNRAGYLATKNDHHLWSVNKELISTYTHKYQNFLLQCDLKMELEVAKKFVFDRYDLVLNTIAKSNEVSKMLLDKILLNVTLPEVLDAYENNLNVNEYNSNPLPKIDNEVVALFKNTVGVDNKFVDSIRNISIELKNKDLNQAIKFMTLAYLLRPQGPVIKKQLVDMKAIQLNSRKGG